MNKYTPISVTLSAQERAIIKGLMEPMSTSLSGALRFIILDWQRIQEITPDDPKNVRIVPHVSTGRERFFQEP